MTLHLQGDLRIAHCGGFHSGLDRLITAFNVLAKLLHHPIRWDSETVGCEPSLSSIPAAEQRTLLTAMQELADWLAMPQNQQEFLIVFFDDQMDLASWVSVHASFAAYIIHNLLDYICDIIWLKCMHGVHVRDHHSLSFLSVVCIA